MIKINNSIIIFIFFFKIIFFMIMKLNKIIDLMGRELKENAVGINIYQYSDGTIEKRVKAN